MLNRSDVLPDWLPWLFPLTPDVIATKSGGMLRVVRLDLPDLETASREALIAHHGRLEEAFGRLTTGWTVWLDQWRRRSPGYLPPSDFGGNRAARIVDDARRAVFEDRAGRVFANAAFLAVHYVPRRRDEAMGFLMEDDIGAVRARLDGFLEETDGLFGTLAHLMPGVDVLEGDALATYLAGTVSYRAANMRLPPAYLDGQLGGVEWHTDDGVVIDGQHLRTVEVHNYGPASPMTTEQLHELPFEARWCLTMHFLDGAEQRAEIERMRKNWLMKRKSFPALLADALMRNPDAGRSRPEVDRSLAELDAIQGDIMARQFAHAHLNVHVWDTSRREAHGRAAQVANFLKAQGLNSRIARLNAVFAPLGDVPGNVNGDLVNLRRPRVPLAALTRLAPVTGVSGGSRADGRLKAPALLVADTRRGVPLYWPLHAPGSDVGHTAVIGPTGAGKSTLLAFMALQFLKYEGAGVVLFDRHASFMVTCLCAGGDWIELGGGGHGVQPLRAVDRPAERAWAHGWLTKALGMRGLEPRPHRDEALDEALAHVAMLPDHERTLSALHAFLGGDAEARAALRHYLTGGPYGKLFDGVVPSYGAASVIGVETDAIIRLEEAAPLAVTAVFRALQRERMTGANPKLVIVDEAWSLLNHPLFRGELESMARELRKLNAALVLATQSLADLRDGSARVILDQVANNVFLPDAKAGREQTRELYARIGLSDEQIDLLRGARPKDEYLLQTLALTRLVSVRLSGGASRVCGASGVADQARARALLASGVEPGPAFVEAWLAESHGEDFADGWVAERKAAE